MLNHQIAHNNHYVPQFYLKNWSEDKKSIWGYRLLVSNSGVPNWRQFSIGNIACRRDLYTTIKGGQEVDEFEKLLEQEIEIPAQESISKVLKEKKLNSVDWERLIYFLATQDLRTPLSYLESKNRWENTLQPVLQKSLEKGVQEYQKFIKSGKDNRLNHDRKYEFFDNLVSYQIVRENRGGQEQTHIKAELPIGRKMWVEVQKYHLKENVKVLLTNKWSIVKPIKGLTWSTSDHPVIKLEFNDMNDYNLKGGWGKINTNIFMPLSPNHLIFTQVGNDISDSLTFSYEMTFNFQKFIAEKAFRFIFSDYKNHIIPCLRPRLVDAKLYEFEKKQWFNWHNNQSQSEIKYD